MKENFLILFAVTLIIEVNILFFWMEAQMKKKGFKYSIFQIRFKVFDDFKKIAPTEPELKSKFRLFVGFFILIQTLILAVYFLF